MELDFAADIAPIQQIDGLRTILATVCRMTEMGFAAVAPVTEDRWIVCGELQVETANCDEMQQHGQAVIIDPVVRASSWQSHPTPARYGRQSYVAVPIVLPDSRFWGTLCAIDPKSARLDTAELVGKFRLFAELIAMHVDTIDRLAAINKALAEERRNAELRERFIAVLSHDLLSPIMAINAEASALLRTRLEDDGLQIVDAMKHSVRRMANLIRDLGDLTRGRFGGGLSVHRVGLRNLEPTLMQVITEARRTEPGRAIESEFHLKASINCDRARIAQLLSNLLSNALRYGYRSSPVRVRGIIGKGSFELSVSNSGDPIPAAEIPRLFEPFTRGEVERNQHSLGLGLYIALEIARAHGGTLTASSSVEETRFTFRMPIR